MQTFAVNYRVENTYENPVEEATFQLLVLPASIGRQHLVRFDFRNSLNEDFFTSFNHFGFPVLKFHTRKKFEKLELELEAIVERPQINPYDFPLTIFPEQDYQELESPSVAVTQGQFIYPTPLTQVKDVLTELFPLDKSVPLFENLRRWNTQLNDMMTYAKDTTSFETTGDEAWEQKEGVCQDFAHVFLAICRQYRIPSRYVSGYLHQPEEERGSQLHAWAEVFVPSVGWKGFDPSNDLLADHNYIKIAHGIDYSDCSPIRGVLNNAGEQKTTYEVQVVDFALQQQQQQQQ